MIVDTNDGDGSCPLVMNFVEMFVQPRVMRKTIIYEKKVMVHCCKLLTDQLYF